MVDSDAAATTSSAKKALNVEPVNAPPPSPLEAHAHHPSSVHDLSNEARAIDAEDAEPEKKTRSSVEGLKGFAAGTASGLTKVGLPILSSHLSVYM
jgi:hypothetical protein